MEVTGKIALITGASSGIGAQMAHQLAKRGATVILTARSEEKLRGVAASLPGQHAVRRLDVTDSAQVESVLSGVIGDFGRIDILINNAGYGVFDRFVDAPLAEYERMMDVNYFGTVRCTKAVLPHMLALRSGHIVNIASLAGKFGSAKSAGYSATKHAVLGFTNSLRQELAGTGVKLTAINPGPIDTPFFDIADPGGHYVKNVSWLMLKPDKVAAAVIRAIERETPEVVLPRYASSAIKLAQLFPRTFDRIALRTLNKK
ncbi:oxidoreductase [Gordoniibacillus kamchatkensis]|uniref:Oxidoreductase n=1 Tax=Gordoniibacillus kamchatkensis TaxID=1590651 RepID=A0ABR5A3K9_9BACL|nr:SDR family oxidoreductase [Paenibacillus sp. VKM B-2647]KIL35614.1 oxidoreductase [Paenibacillus sp. VKM B-2647]